MNGIPERVSSFLLSGNTRNTRGNIHDNASSYYFRAGKKDDVKSINSKEDSFEIVKTGRSESIDLRSIILNNKDEILNCSKIIVRCNTLYGNTKLKIIIDTFDVIEQEKFDGLRTWCIVFSRRTEDSSGIKTDFYSMMKNSSLEALCKGDDTFLDPVNRRTVIIDKSNIIFLDVSTLTTTDTPNLARIQHKLAVSGVFDKLLTKLAECKSTPEIRKTIKYSSVLAICGILSVLYWAKLNYDIAINHEHKPDDHINYLCSMIYRHTSLNDLQMSEVWTKAMDCRTIKCMQDFVAQKYNINIDMLEHLLQTNYFDLYEDQDSITTSINLVRLVQEYIGIL